MILEISLYVRWHQHRSMSLAYLYCSVLFLGNYRKHTNSVELLFFLFLSICPSSLLYRRMTSSFSHGVLLAGKHSFQHRNVCMLPKRTGCHYHLFFFFSFYFFSLVFCLFLFSTFIVFMEKTNVQKRTTF